MSPEALVPLASSAKEIAELRQAYKQQLDDAQVADQSADGRYIDAYMAGFTLAKLVVRAAGYRVKGGENHRDMWLAVPWCMGTTVQPRVDFLAAARGRRNKAMYDAVGLIDDEDVELLLEQVQLFESAALKWVSEKHLELIED